MKDIRKNYKLSVLLMGVIGAAGTVLTAGFLAAVFIAKKLIRASIGRSLDS
ncbi:MAG: hypothetical protein Q4P65_02095 [Eubacteriales bacterium]|nr:hypothetical protein [Eubacteriales bacterium]